MVWACPKCGSGAGFSINRRVNGWESWAYYGGERTAVEISDDSQVRRSWPKTGRCITCERIVEIPLRSDLPLNSAYD